MTSPKTAPLESAIEAWRIGAGATALLVAAVPAAAWSAPIPHLPRRSIRAIAAHLHNCRAMWLKTLGPEHGVPLPARVDTRRVTQRQLAPALDASAARIAELLQVAAAAGGRLPGRGAFVWGAVPRGLVHLVAYTVAHEAHHRGQIVQAARQLGHPIPKRAIAGLWQWSSRLREVRSR
jgi:uncharacterized damage-inducible protein DinB